MRLDEMSWPEVEAYLKRDDRIILVVGSCEQHGPHLPLGTDTLIPLAIAERVSRRTGVIYAPPLAFGMSLHHLAFPGTCSFTPDVLSRAFQDMVRTLVRHGFARFLVLNGHGGNTSSLSLGAVTLFDQGLRFVARVSTWWTEEAVARISDEALGQRQDLHAGPVETAVLGAARPGLAHPERFQATETPLNYPISPDEFRKLAPHGAVGATLTLPAEVGERVLEAAVESYCNLLEEMRRSP